MLYILLYQMFYKIVSSFTYIIGTVDERQASHIRDLELKVAAFLMEGWRCQGGVVITYDNEGIVNMYQTMVKRGPLDKDT